MLAQPLWISTTTRQRWGYTSYRTLRRWSSNPPHLSSSVCINAQTWRQQRPSPGHIPGLRRLLGTSTFALLNPLSGWSSTSLLRTPPRLEPLQQKSRWPSAAHIPRKGNDSYRRGTATVQRVDWFQQKIVWFNWRFTLDTTIQVYIYITVPAQHPFTSKQSVKQHEQHHYLQDDMRRIARLRFCSVYLQDDMRRIARLRFAPFS